MAFTNRYSNTIRGALTFTGNTAGLSKFANQNNQGQVASIGAFTSLNTGLVVGDYPSGTTTIINQNGSSANLVIPPGSTIVYAELIWGGNYFGQDGNDGTTVSIAGLINNPVSLTTPNGTNSITPDTVTATNETQSTTSPLAPLPFISSFYSRSDDVTSFIAPLGPGTHLISVEDIPGLTEPVDNRTSQTNHAGWTLAVAYSNPTMPYRNLNIWVGGNLVRATTPPQVVDIAINGFTTPSSGTLNARLLISAQEGDASLGGDQLLFGPTIATATAISGPNNPLTNFFGSQINDDNGDLNITGTFGSRNQDPFTLTNIDGGRQGWDITNIDASSRMLFNQTSAALRLYTSQDTYMPNTIGTQIDVQSPTITIHKNVDKTSAVKGDRIRYTLEIDNTGTIATSTFNLVDVAPVGTLIDVTTISISNATGPVINTSTPASININLGPVAVGQTVTVQYEVITTILTPSPITNDALGTFAFTPGIGQLPITDTTTSNTVTTDLASVSQSKSVSDAEALVGDVVTYTVTIDNSQSAVSLTNVYVYDPLQSGTSYVASSTSIGLAPPIDANPSIAPGVSVPIVLAGQVLTVSFDVKINVLPTPNPILNTADVTFRVGTSTATQTTNETEVLVLQPDISAVKDVDRSLAQVGDTLTYTTTITNTGNVPLQNIIFTDTPPANTTFIPNTVIIDGNSYAGLSPNIPIDFLAVPIVPNIFPLAPGGSVDISYQATIDTLPSPPEIKNTASVSYDILVDGNSRRLSETTNEVVTDIFVITVVKDVNKVAAEGGDTLTYTSTITTTIPGDYGSPIIFKDVAPAGTTLVPASITASGSTFTNNSTSTDVILNFGNVFPANPIVVTFNVVINNNVTGPILNTSQVDLRTETINSNQVQTDIVKPAVSKLSSTLNTLVGGIVTYTVTIDNSTGQAPLTNVYVLDALQSGTSYVSGTTVIGVNPPINSNPSTAPGIPVGVVGAGQIQTVSFQVRVDTFPSPNPILNTANINYQVDGQSKTLTTNQTNVFVQSPDINIVKSVDKIFAQVGETVTYTSTITNTGTVNLDNIIFNDAPPANTVYDGNGVKIGANNYPALNPNSPIDIGATNPGLFPLIPGASITVSYKAIITALPSPPQIQNTSSADYLFTVSGNQQRRTESGNTVTTTIYELDIVKDVDNIAAEVGDVLTYTFTITSNISGNIGVPINFIDNIPNETTFVLGSVTVTGVPIFADNSTATQVNLDLGNTIPANPIVVTFDVKIDNNAVGPILDISELNVNGIITSSNQVRTDIVNLNISKLVSSPEAEVGETITYTVRIDNSQSNAPVNNVYVFDDLQTGTSYIAGSTVIDGNTPIDSNPSISPGVNVGTVPAGAVIDVSFDVRIDTFPTPNPVLNSANVNYEVDGVPKSKTTNETQVLTQRPDIQITKSVDKAFAKLGDTLIYTVVTKNTGTVDLQNLIFTDAPPSNTVYDGNGVTIEGTLYPALNPNSPIDIGAINPVLFPVAPGGTIEVSFGVIITNIPNPPVITNTATIDYFYLINNEDRQREESNTVTTELFNLAIVKSASPTSVERGDIVTYTSTITSNIVGDIGTDIIFRDVIPAGTTLVPGSINVTGIPTFGNNSTPTEVILDLDQVFPVSPIVVTFKVRVDNNTSGTILNTSTVETSGVPVNSNEVEVDVVILDVTKGVSVPEEEVGGIVTYTVTIDNSQGSAPINNVYVFDTLQTGTSYVPGTTVIDGNPPINSNPSVSPGINVGTVLAGDVINVSFDVRLDILPTPNPVLNNANVNYQVDGVSKTQTTNETEVLVLQPDINITKTVDKSFAKLGDPLTYTVVIENTGTVDLENLIFTDAPPSNTVYDGNGVTIEGTLYPALDPNLPIDIGIVNPALFPVTPNGTIEVSFGVTITNVPTPPVIANTATIDFFYLINGQLRQKEENDTVTTEIFNLSIVKSSSPTNVERGDTITYTSTITSDMVGDIGTDIIFRDIIPAGTTLVPGSINVSGVLLFTNNSTPTEIILNLGQIFPVSPIVVTFKVTVNNNTSGIIPNTSVVETSGVPVNSNEVDVGTVILDVTKDVSALEAEVGEAVTYTVTIDNSQSTSPINNVHVFDNLQVGTSYVPGTTVIDGNPPIDSNPSIPPGINVGIVAAGDIIRVSFDVSIDVSPTPNPILNTSYVNYNIDNQPNSKITNETEVLVQEPDIEVTKTVDKFFAKLGDPLTYDVSIKNTGTVDLQNLIFTDSPPINTVYDGNGVTINGTLYPALNPNNPINIGSIAPALFPLLIGDTITVSFGVIITNVPTPPVIDNMATIDYFYLIDDQLRRKTESDNVETQIFNLDILKSVNPTSAERGDTVTFTSTITSDISGDIDTDIIFRDIIPTGTTLVPGSINVAGVPSFVNNSTATEIILDLGTVLPQNPIIVTFDVTINNTTSGTIQNISSVETSGVPVDSNKVELDIVIVNVNKTTLSKEAEVGEIITYTVAIDNSQSIAPIEKVFLFDVLQSGISYVPNSTVIDSNPPINSNPSISPGVNIGTINAGDVVTVSFDVKINQLPNPNPALNKANINYEVGKIPKTKITNETQVLVFNPSTTLVKGVNNSFTQVGETLVYTSTITNTGNIALNSILFSDFIPSNTAYDGLGVKINGTNYPLLSPNVPIDIGLVNPALLPLLPGGDIEISFGVIVTSVPSTNEIKNTSEMTFGYLIDGETRSRTEKSNEVISKVIDLDLIKEVNPQIAEKSDIVTFKTTINSNVAGNISSPIVFKDILPLGTELVLGSVSVSGIIGFTDLSTLNKVEVNLGNVLPPNPMTVSFKVRILDNAQSPINNISLVDIRGKETESNESTLDLVILEVSKSVNDDIVAVGETITYSVLLDNTKGSADATNVFLLDLLQSGTSYVANSTKINGGSLQNLNPSIPPGINIGVVPARSAILVTFEASVDELPSQNPILNTATINYNAGKKESNQITNETKVKVESMDIVKSVNPKFAQVGDKLTYTSVIKNSGQVPIENIIFSDPPPTNTTYINPSVKINNVLYPTLNPSSPIDLSLVAPSLLPLEAGETITIEFSASVETLPEIPIVDNTSSIEYSYLDGNVLKTKNKESNLVDTVIREGELVLEKSADKDVVLVGDTMTYTIKVKNVGNIEVENVMLTDIIPPDTEFIEGSVIVNGVPDSSLNPANGINLGTILAPLTYIVSFDVKVVKLPVSKKIINNASVKYEVFVNPDGPPVIENRTSNNVITIVELLSIKIAKVCSPGCVAVGDEIEYSFTIVNNGTVDIVNIKLIDEIPEETSYVLDSFIGATSNVTDQDLISGVPIGNLSANSTKEVSFKVKVEKIPCGFNITNKASIDYEYSLDKGETFQARSSESNECSVCIKNISFTQTFKDAILDIPSVKPDIENIVDVEVKFVCTGHKIIDTPIGVSKEGQNLSGKKLILNGKLCITVVYVAEVETQTVHTAHFELCVCEYVVIPNSADFDCNINPNIYIEDIFFEKINSRQLFVNMVYIVESGI